MKLVVVLSLVLVPLLHTTIAAATTIATTTTITATITSVTYFYYVTSVSAITSAAGGRSSEGIWARVRAHFALVRVGSGMRGLVPHALGCPIWFSGLATPWACSEPWGSARRLHGSACAVGCRVFIVARS